MGLKERLNERFFVVISPAEVATQFHSNNIMGNTCYYAYALDSQTAEEYISQFTDSDRMWYMDVSLYVLAKLHKKFGLQQILRGRYEYDECQFCEIVCTKDEMDYFAENMDYELEWQDEEVLRNAKRILKRYYRTKNSKMAIRGLKKILKRIDDGDDKIRKYPEYAYYNMRCSGLR